MSKSLDKLKQHRHYDKSVNILKLISIVGSTEILLKGIGFISGILIVRLLPIQEYAFYTLANTMLGTLVVLTDGGISNGVMALSGKVWQDPKKLGSILATGLDLRRKFAVITLLFAAPIIIYLLVLNKASWLTALLILLSLIPAFYADLSDSLLEITPKLHQDIASLQKNQLTVGFGRLMLTLLTIFIFPWTYVILLASGLPRIYGNLKLKKINEKFVDSNQKPDPIIRKEILRIVTRILPNIIFFAFSGQIVIWILSVFGNTNELASIGALGRFSILIGLFTSVLATLFIPRFSRLGDHKSKILKAFFIFQLILFLFSGFVMLIVLLFPAQMLWILGASYSGLTSELFLIILANCIGLISSLTGNLIGSRGHFLNPILVMTMNLATVTAAFFIWDLSTLHGILYYSILYQCISLMVNYSFSFYKLICR
ncbi:lipopolysaccharide biosynthesis protein [Flavobacterium cellulosilyticum]|uniref:Polysaccharide biosynthesis protein n=1 Tax=Flavobacterium cellulosilyticum TaxID=2541731 RepID=A0A4R5C4P1_9FLAO|nr:polysaccharide biosynthesis protein [Flavobacterium cellulosilyticum]TDD94671.1 polysaccharide biosynthesis protein [Flavobacterium cellulosilyticum]